MNKVEFCTMSAAEQACLGSLVSALPANPTVVEIGSFIGGSLVVMHRARPDARFISIEDFVSIGTGTALNGETYTWYDLQGQSSRELFTANTAHIEHLEMHAMHGSSGSYRGIFDHIQCDMLFEDAGLTDVDYWLARVKPGGLFCGHDYRDNAYYEARGWPTGRGNVNDLKSAEFIRQFVSDQGAEFNLVDTLWWFVKPH
jgi:hypothetical protein